MGWVLGVGCEVVSQVVVTVLMIIEHVSYMYTCIYAHNFSIVVVSKPIPSHRNWNANGTKTAHLLVIDHVTSGGGFMCL